MPLLTVFLIIAVTLIVTIGLLWLISWLMGSREAKDEEVKVDTHTESVIVTAPEPVSAAAEEPRPAVVTEPDDLKVIEGIGPKIAGLLNKSGIVTFTQLASTKVIILESILKEANLRISNPSTWPDQAALAAEDKWDELQKLQDELLGGRKVA